MGGVCLLIDLSGAWRGKPMDVFTKLFGDLLVFVYHCFDRIKVTNIRLVGGSVE